MKQRYHINPETGKSGVCKAQTPTSCDFYNSEQDIEAPHFSTEKEARVYGEALMNSKHGNFNSFSKAETIIRDSEHSIKNNQLNIRGERVKDKNINTMFKVGRRAKKNLYRKFKEDLRRDSVPVYDQNIKQMFAA